MTTSNPPKILGMNPMGLGAPLYDAYFYHQKNEQYSLMFIKIFSKNHQRFRGIKPMGLGAPWANTYL